MTDKFTDNIIGEHPVSTSNLEQIFQVDKYQDYPDYRSGIIYQTQYKHMDNGPPDIEPSSYPNNSIQVVYDMNGTAHFIFPNGKEQNEVKEEETMNKDRITQAIDLAKTIFD